MSLAKEFRDFVAKGNVLDLAVAVVIGAAFTKIINAVVEGLVMPLVGAVLPEGDWRTWTVTGLEFQLGAVIGATIDFLLVGLVLFIIVKKLLAVMKKQEVKAPEAPKTKTCPECLEEIPIAAHKCRACASPQPS